MSMPCCRERFTTGTRPRNSLSCPPTALASRPFWRQAIPCRCLWGHACRWLEPQAQTHLASNRFRFDQANDPGLVQEVSLGSTSGASGRLGVAAASGQSSARTVRCGNLMCARTSGATGASRGDDSVWHRPGYRCWSRQRGWKLAGGVTAEELNQSPVPPASPGWLSICERRPNVRQTK